VICRIIKSTLFIYNFQSQTKKSFCFGNLYLVWAKNSSTLNILPFIRNPIRLKKTQHTKRILRNTVSQHSSRILRTLQNWTFTKDLTLSFSTEDLNIPSLLWNFVGRHTNQGACEFVLTLFPRFLFYCFDHFIPSSI
jgi:hypothetical protein